MKKDTRCSLNDPRKQTFPRCKKLFHFILPNLNLICFNFRFDNFEQELSGELAKGMAEKNWYKSGNMKHECIIA